MCVCSCTDRTEASARTSLLIFSFFFASVGFFRLTPPPLLSVHPRVLPPQSSRWSEPFVVAIAVCCAVCMVCGVWCVSLDRHLRSDSYLTRNWRYRRTLKAASSFSSRGFFSIA